jgi:hypothetical protein
MKRMNRRMYVMMIAAVLAGVGVVLFLLPHHRGYESSASLAKDLREMVAEGQIESPAALVLSAAVVVGCVSVLLPALLAASIAFVPERATRGVLSVGGVVLLMAGISTFLVEIFSNMMIGFGNSSKYPETTWVAVLAPLFPLVCGVVAIVMGFGRFRIP